MQNKRKIINDPVYGFISIYNELIYDIISLPCFQRLRRIKQLGLSHYVYPGATHTRFEHVLGAMHLMNAAIKSLRFKGNKISEKEEEATLIAILLHDIGHGPFSHTLEHSFMNNISHEDISLAFMKKINKIFNGKLELAIKIFTNKYHKKYLHTLISGQIDMDRLDYLRRDSFFTGVVEGNIGSDRIIKMLDIKNDELVIEEKGIYSIEKFLIARRIMYWQVYLHKTVVSAELMLLKTLKRAKWNATQNGVFAVPNLAYFFDNNIDNINILTDNKLQATPLEIFAQLDDNDIIASMKVWQNSGDNVLAELSKRLLNRNLFKIEISKTPFSKERIENLKEKAKKIFKLNNKDIEYFVFSETIRNKAYSFEKSGGINILHKNNKITDIASASDVSNITALSETVEKYFLCYPHECG